MNDWKARVDQSEAQSAAEREAAYRRSWEESQKREEEERQRRQREYQARLEIHKRKYVCKVCGKPSSGPTVGYPVKSTSYSGDRVTCVEEDHDNPQYYWDSPIDLHECMRCRERVCDNHYHKGICKTCAEKYH